MQTKNSTTFAAPRSHIRIARPQAPALLRFKKVTPQSMKEIAPFLNLEQGRTTDFSFGGILMWVDYFNYEYCILDDTLFIKGLVEDNTSIPAFSLPIGRLPLSKAVEHILAYCRQYDIAPQFSAVPEHALSDFLTLTPTQVDPLSDWGDYLYEIEKLATLSGKKMSKKRNHVNRFDALYPDATIEPVGVNNINDIQKFMDIYDSEADGAPMEKTESRLTRKILNLFADPEFTDMEGIAIRIDGKIIAFSIGDIKGDTLFVHIEKASRAYSGSYEKINREFAAYMLSRYPQLRFVNREDDGGDAGLRQAKESYHPLEILRKYNILL